MDPLAPAHQKLVVFSDLDGTLLDHNDYDFTPARPALDRLAALQVPLVLASSKTAAEIAPLQAALGLGKTPAIVENGAAIFWPDEPRWAGDGYQSLRATLALLPPVLRRQFIGFGDMDTEAVAEVTGLDPESAGRARQRQHSEPGVWTGSPADERAFIAALARHGIFSRRGGRFLTLSQGATKADRLAELARALGADTTLALGDAPNDAEMLEAADHGVIVRNDHGPGIPPLAGEKTGRITRTARQGPAGWNEAVLAFIEQFLNERVR